MRMCPDTAGCLHSLQVAADQVGFQLVNGFGLPQAGLFARRRSRCWMLCLFRTRHPG